MELAGLIIGAAAAIIPAYQGIDKLCGTISDTKRFSSQLENLWWQVRTHKTKLENECILLFGDDFDTDEVKAMLQDQNHPKWSDTGFKHRFKQHLGEAFDSSLGSFRVINITLKELEEEIKKFAPTSRAGSVSFNSPFLSRVPDPLTGCRVWRIAVLLLEPRHRQKLPSKQQSLKQKP